MVGETMAKEYKYPYIPKEYYPAVMYACKKIRETRWFNKSIEWAYDEYSDRGLDYEQLKKYVSERAGAGHKKQYCKPLKYYVVRENEYQAEWYDPHYNYSVMGTRDIEKLKERLRKSEFEYNAENDYGGPYADTIELDAIPIAIPQKKIAKKIVEICNNDEELKRMMDPENARTVRRIIHNVLKEQQ